MIALSDSELHGVMLPWPPCGLPWTGAELAGSSGTCATASSTATTATMPACCRRVPQGIYPRSSARYELARAAGLEDLRQAVDDAAWKGHQRWMALRDVRWCREWLLPHEKRLSTSKQYRLISERQNWFLDRHPEYLERPGARRRRLVARGA